MKYLKIITALILLGLLSGRAAAANDTTVVSAGRPLLCLNYVYLPLMNKNGGGGTMNQAVPAQHAALMASQSDQPDFNGDGCADLAVGVPSEDLGSGGSHGSVNVIYGGSNGLTGEHNQAWNRTGGYDAEGNSLGDIQESINTQDSFGETLATGDFNNDGFTDLAIGVPFATTEGDANAGAVQVIYGSENGLVSAGNQFFGQNGLWTDPEGDGSGIYQGDLYGGPEFDDRFGSALAVGYFNNDDYADLAIGVFYEDIGSIENAGAVNVVFGSSTGLTWVNNQFWSQDGGTREDHGTGNYYDIGDILGAAEDSDWFGSSLAAGDFNNDGLDDLAIGAYWEDIGSIDRAGAVNILRGGNEGLVATYNQHWHQQAAYLDIDADGTSDITIGDPTGVVDDGDWFGYSLAAGDFNGDFIDDLAVGVPHEDLFDDGTEVQDVGVVQVFHGGNTHLTLTGQRWIQQNRIYDGQSVLGDVPGSEMEAGDQFGKTLTVGDLNGDGFADLAIGAPDEALDQGIDVGSVNVFYGGGDGLDIVGHQWISLDSVILFDGTDLGPLLGIPSAQDQLGFGLSAADFNNDGYDELAIGIPGFDFQSSTMRTGALNVMAGSMNGLTISNNMFWTQNGGWGDDWVFLGDLYGGGENGDRFGEALP